MILGTIYPDNSLSLKTKKHFTYINHLQQQHAQYSPQMFFFLGGGGLRKPYPHLCRIERLLATNPSVKKIVFLNRFERNARIKSSDENIEEYHAFYYSFPLT